MTTINQYEIWRYIENVLVWRYGDAVGFTHNVWNFHPHEHDLTHIWIDVPSSNLEHVYIHQSWHVMTRVYMTLHVIFFIKIYIIVIIFIIIILLLLILLLILLGYHHYQNITCDYTCIWLFDKWNVCSILYVPVYVIAVCFSLRVRCNVLQYYHDYNDNNNNNNNNNNDDDDDDNNNNNNNNNT